MHINLSAFPSNADYRDFRRVSLEESFRTGKKRTYGENSRHSSPSGVHLPSILRRRSPEGDASSLSHHRAHRAVPRFHFHSAPPLAGLGRGSRHLPSSASTRVHRESISRNRCLTPPLPLPHRPQVVNTRTNAFLTRTRERTLGVRTDRAFSRELFTSLYPFLSTRRVRNVGFFSLFSRYLSTDSFFFFVF